MVTCDFHLDGSEKGVFYAGKLIKGHVELFFEKPISVRSVSLLIHGKAHCKFVAVEFSFFSKTGTKYVQYEGVDKYIKSETYLFGTKGATAQEMPAGTHRYDFRYRLPHDIPGSVESKKGYIRYFIEVQLDLPWRFDKEFKLQLNIARREDLNIYPELFFPRVGEDRRDFYCFCCKSEPLMLQVRIPHGGFVAGQSIPITFEYSNKSGVAVSKAKIQLNRVETLNSVKPKTNTKILKTSMLEKMCSGAEGMGDTVLEVLLDLPADLHTTNTRFSRIVQISYELQIEAYLPACKKNMLLIFPITIGTVPFDVNRKMPKGEIGGSQSLYPVGDVLIMKSGHAEIPLLAQGEMHQRFQEMEKK